MVSGSLSGIGVALCSHEKGESYVSPPRVPIHCAILSACDEVCHPGEKRDHDLLFDHPPGRERAFAPVLVSSV